MARGLPERSAGACALQLGKDRAAVQEADGAHGADIRTDNATLSERWSDRPAA